MKCGILLYALFLAQCLSWLILHPSCAPFSATIEQWVAEASQLASRAIINIQNSIRQNPNLEELLYAVGYFGLTPDEELSPTQVQQLGNDIIGWYICSI